MGTKNDPGNFDCYANALPDEPMFILLARDTDAAYLVKEWAAKRRRDVLRGLRPQSDLPMIDEAQRCATNMIKWRRENDGAWRPLSAPPEKT